MKVENGTNDVESVVSRSGGAADAGGRRAFSSLITVLPPTRLPADAQKQLYSLHRLQKYFRRQVARADGGQRPLRVCNECPVRLGDVHVHLREDGASARRRSVRLSVGPPLQSSLDGESVGSVGGPTARRDDVLPLHLAYLYGELAWPW